MRHHSLVLSHPEAQQPNVRQFHCHFSQPQVKWQGGLAQGWSEQSPLNLPCVTVHSKHTLACGFHNFIKMLLMNKRSQGLNCDDMMAVKLLFDRSSKVLLTLHAPALHMPAKHLKAALQEQQQPSHKAPGQCLPYTMHQCHNASTAAFSTPALPPIYNAPEPQCK
eukprot:1162691-Lingulodinium_polyedra.AAC.1